MTKKNYKQKYFSENSNWEILTKNLVTFERRRDLARKRGFDTPMCTMTAKLSVTFRLY